MSDDPALLVGGQIRKHLGDPNTRIVEGGRGTKEVGTHALGRGEEEQDGTDTEGRRPHLLRRERPRVGVGERPHGERRSGVNAHEREHVGQHHDACPKTPHRGFLAETGGELDDARNGEVGVVVAPAPALGGLPFADIRLTHFGQFLAKGGPAAQLAIGDDADDDDAEGQQDALHRVHIGHGAKTAGRHVDEHDRRQQPHAEFNTDQAVGQSVEQKARRAELQPEIRDREQQGHDHHEDTDRIPLEISGQHLARCHETEAFANHPLAFQEHHAGKRNGDRVERRVCVLETVTVDQPRMAHKGPARERCCRGGQHEDPHRELAARDEVIAGRFRHPRALDAPINAIGPIKRNEYEQPHYFS